MISSRERESALPGSMSSSSLGAASPLPAKRLRRSPPPEPTSVLYNRSPSPPTSSSALISADDWEAVLSQDSDSCWIMDAFVDPFLTPPPCQDPAAVDLFLQAPLPAADYLLDPRAVVDDLLEAARRADSGDSTGAREILARLNHRLPSPPLLRAAAPLLRAAAHLRDALLHGRGSVSSSPLDVALKLAAHKALADASPTVQFAAFTSTQLLLDALAGARRVHVVDLDIGFGARWPPLLQELALQWRRAELPPPSLKVTALVSPGSSSAPHPLELHLTHESLARFAADLGISFEFAAVVFDDTLAGVGAPGEAVAVHLPAVGLSPATLRAVKQLRPAVVVCVDDHGGGDLLSVVRSSAAFLESLDAAGAPADAVDKVEQYILRPRVDRLVLAGGHRLPWQTMLASAGFSPVQLSGAAEAQAECLVRRTTTPGFHVDKRQAALALRWKQTDLVTVSAWRY